MFVFELMFQSCMVWYNYFILFMKKVYCFDFEKMKKGNYFNLSIFWNNFFYIWLSYVL